MYVCMYICRNEYRVYMSEDKWTNFIISCQVIMVSGCMDEQTSADVSTLAEFKLREGLHTVT